MAKKRGKISRTERQVERLAEEIEAKFDRIMPITITGQRVLVTPRDYAVYAMGRLCMGEIRDLLKIGTVDREKPSWRQYFLNEITGYEYPFMTLSEYRNPRMPVIVIYSLDGLANFMKMMGASCEPYDDEMFKTKLIKKLRRRGHGRQLLAKNTTVRKMMRRYTPLETLRAYFQEEGGKRPMKTQ